MYDMSDRMRVVLVADDDAGALMLAEAALAGAGFVVVTANDGQAAVEVYRETRPDCVVLDVMMPGLTGFQACAAIREMDGGGQVPVLMLTSRDDMASISEAFAAGASDFAIKGMNPRLLSERVRFMLRTADLQDEVIASQQRLTNAQRMARIGHWEIDFNGKTVDVSPVTAEVLQCRPQDLRHRDDLLCRVRPADRAQVLDALRDAEKYGGSFGLDLKLDAEDADERFLHLEGALTDRGASARALGITLTLQDTTQLRRAEEHAHWLAYFDPVTQLPNIRYLMDRMQQYIRLAVSDRLLSVLVVRLADLDSLKATRGVAFGEEFKKQVAARLSAAIVPQGGDAQPNALFLPPVVAAIGSGEFAVLLPGCESPSAIAGIADGLLDAVGKPLSVLGQELRPRASIGMALWPQDGGDAEALLSSARAAVVQLEADAPGGCTFYSPALQAKAVRRVALEQDLRGALTRGELELVFQPRVSIATGETQGAEALVRWRHPVHGLLSPVEFIPLAEESNLIAEMGLWVLRQGCKDLALWRAATGKPLKLSVNLSARQLRDGDLTRHVQAALDRSGLPASALELELTETAIMTAPDAGRRVLEEIRELGVKLSLDDFGTGYSSLGYLRTLPVDCLKVDRSFVKDLLADVGTQGIVSAVVTLARTFGMRTVAEGVEDPATAEFLLKLGCEEAQGFYYAPPLSSAVFMAYLLPPKEAEGGAAQASSAA
jgi:predicted signal transduction protein with EAL and GGDEF domain/DNA-binding NarL/FixJ family response regulator